MYFIVIFYICQCLVNSIIKYHVRIITRENLTLQKTIHTIKVSSDTLIACFRIISPSTTQTYLQKS